MTLRNLVLLTTIAAAAAAQDMPERSAEVGAKMKENAEALKSYSYKRRTELQVHGQSRGSKVDLVRYVDGNRQVIPIESPQRSGDAPRGRGMRGRMIEKKKQEMKEDAGRLMQLFQTFIEPGSGGMSGILEKAVISREGSSPDADIKLVAKGVARPSDSFMLVWSVADKRPRKVEIKADVDGSPAQLTVEYAALADGPYYPARTVVSVPKKNLLVNIDTYDYSRQ